MMFKLHNVTDAGYNTWMHAAFHRALKRYYSREIGDFESTLLQIYCSALVPKITKIEFGLTKLLQK